LLDSSINDASYNTTLANHPLHHPVNLNSNQIQM